MASSIVRGQFSFSSLPNGPGELRLHAGSGQFCQSLHNKGLGEMEDLASGPESHPAPPSGPSYGLEFIGSLGLLAGSLGLAQGETRWPSPALTAGCQHLLFF